MWLSDYWEIYLQELLWLEGRGDFVNICVECNTNSPLYHCRGCFGGQLLCQECTVLGHALVPLHCLEYWNGTFFQKTSLKSLGLHIQLGHIPSEICGNPKCAFNDDFTVIDSHGIHTVAVDYCDCKSVKSLVQQLLQVSWFPATVVNPCSVTTFCLLQEFQLLSFELKVSAYEFYQSLARNSNNNGVSDIKDHYESFICSVCEWHHLRMLKWSGCCHDPAGIINTASGECAIWCPACPHPGINLPNGWENTPPEKNDAMDPSLSDGWGYFIQNSMHFMFHYLMIMQTSILQKSTCSSHSAINMADSKSNQGLATTGVRSIVCVCHNFKYPNGVVNLEKGERCVLASIFWVRTNVSECRYANMDYAFFSAMWHSSCGVLNVSYDIACKLATWEKCQQKCTSNFLKP
ncbi:hypothetical protein PISMIDRAFT_30884 [Pisolithus microcarpus 441]|uniref:CxC2-like cysteine cluster KDZ transposase-associated domain-containing protein n=1 Tax=Pisolithus microcarpus 441 TaxID=765257 RepID=A0A0C9XW03_9AGAM|nr:hypothetical protein PISMIDRAFT_30884 [Pisolithus microcarpus 441]